MPISSLHLAEQKHRPVSFISVSQDSYSCLTHNSSSVFSHLYTLAKEPEDLEQNEKEWKWISWKGIQAHPSANSGVPYREDLTKKVLWDTDFLRGEFNLLQESSHFFFFLKIFSKKNPKQPVLFLGLPLFPVENDPLSSRRKCIGFLCGRMVLICHKTLFANSHYGQNYYYFSLAALRFF